MTTMTDFSKWETHAKTLSIGSLKFVIEDCARARDAMRGWNPDKENYYADQCFTYQDELKRRLK